MTQGLIVGTKFSPRLGLIVYDGIGTRLEARPLMPEDQVSFVLSVHGLEVHVRDKHGRCMHFVQEHREEEKLVIEIPARASVDAGDIEMLVSRVAMLLAATCRTPLILRTRRDTLWDFVCLPPELGTETPTHT